MTRATLTQSLNALELVVDDTAAVLRANGAVKAATAAVAIKDNAVGVTLELAAALHAALAGDLEPARTAMRELRLDQLEIR